MKKVLVTGRFLHSTNKKFRRICTIESSILMLFHKRYFLNKVAAACVLVSRSHLSHPFPVALY